jgi:kynureninase
LDPALRTLEEAGIERIRHKGIALGQMVVDLADQWLTPHGFRLASPRAAERRGSHVSFEHPEAWRICQSLLDSGVICDFRRPDRLRLGPAPLYTRFVDVWDAMDRLRGIVARREYERRSSEPARVT